MITTLDKIECKRGEIVWEIGIDLKGNYQPTRSIVHGWHNSVINVDRCWKEYELCKKECERLNNN